jgi:hypothetical protein
MTYTSTYVTLEIGQASFDDIKRRLEAVDCLKDYWDHDREHGDMILFGTVGLVVDKTTRTSMKGCCKYHASGAPAGTACGDHTYTEVR